MEGLLEELIPTREVPSGSSIIDIITNEDTLTDEQKTLIGELFDTLKMAYNHIDRACGVLGILSCLLNTQQPLIILKASIRLLIQVNVCLDFGQKQVLGFDSKIGPKICL